MATDRSTLRAGDPAVRKAFEALSMQPVDPMTSAQLRELMAADTRTY